MHWNVGDRVVAVGTQREGVIVDTDTGAKVSVTFDDGTSMKVFRNRLAAAAALIPPLERYRTYTKSFKDWNPRIPRGPLPNDQRAFPGGIRVGQLRANLQVFLKLVSKMRDAGVNLEHVAVFFKDSERIDAHRTIVMAVHALNYQARTIDDVLRANVKDAVHYLGSIGLAPRNRGGYDATFFYGMERSLEDAAEVFDARIKETRFACRAAFRGILRMLPRNKKNGWHHIWVQHVLPFIPTYSLREAIDR
mmetsp:Transcript_35734/g.76173  ORF Transcript_35734/g.76173 Transcript_35734/m.76173 type:complete len:249 (-) Transcript_35734:41-787(-)